MRYLFGQCALDAGRRELHRAGCAVPVEPQVFDLLLCLLRNRERVVGKDELIASVWDGRIVSDSTLSSRINSARRATGDAGQDLIRTLARRGFRFVGMVREETSPHPAPTPVPSRESAEEEPEQDVTFCRTPDGITLAVAAVGAGPTTLLKTANWLTHVVEDWRSPFWGPLLHHLASGRRLVRYDARGCGLSDRDVGTISFDAFLGDLGAVAEAACGDGPVALLGISQGAAVAVAYAAARPERVSRMILLGGYARGRRRRPGAGEGALADAVAALMREGWGDERSAFMRAYGSLYFPSAGPEALRGWANMQRRSASGEMAVRIRTACDEIDVSGLLPRVRAPTLVLHCRGDTVAPFEEGRGMAAAIPGARFVPLESDNHVVLPDEAEWPRLLAEMERFLSGA